MGCDHPGRPKFDFDAVVGSILEEEKDADGQQVSERAAKSVTHAGNTNQCQGAVNCFDATPRPN